ncbi:helix-turn-helix domain-containing protein [Kaistia algarum]|uniref:hypothetical protein n=1 Tax=Kaistia algarum TaxID=2083279 RepID=UPI0022572CCD|nr:hypothetical protein [Kaistia algarum]MCX5515149.1 hypothetical protein [Kaistia algarum]
MLISARGVIDNFQAQPLLNLVMNDRARFLFLMAVLALHTDPDSNGNRLLPSRLLAFCKERQICSAGRAKAMLAALRWAGYIQPGPLVGDGRARPLVPSEELVAMLRRRWRMQIATVSRLRPEAHAAATALDADPDFAFLCARAFYERLRLGFRVLNHAPTLIPFGESNAAFQILTECYLTYRATAAIPSIAGLARQFSVSRAHVRSTFRAAEAAGLIFQDEAKGALTTTPALHDSMAAFFSASMLTFADIAISLTAGVAGPGVVDPPQRGNSMPISR